MTAPLSVAWFFVRVPKGRIAVPVSAIAIVFISAVPISQTASTAGFEESELKFKRHVVSVQPVLEKLQA